MRRFVQAFAGASGFPTSLPTPVLERLLALPGRFNISIRQAAGVLFMRDQGWQVAEMSWGLVPSWEPAPTTSYSTQTARLERAASSRLYRSSWSSRRCAVPMNGYYKWDRAGTPRQPYFIQAASGEILFAAALWSLWGDPDAEHLASFSILTHPNAAIPPPLVADGPLFLRSDRIGDWIEAAPDKAGSLLRRMHQPALEAYAVSRRVANRKLDDYSLLEPLAALGEPDAVFDPEGDDEDE